MLLRYNIPGAISFCQLKLCNVDSVVNVCPGLPQKLSTKEELCTLLSTAIFTGTVQHAATNNGQVLQTRTCTLGDHW